MYSQYIEDFVDQSYSVPRDIVRICKLISEIDDISNITNTSLVENRRLYMQYKKSKTEKADEIKEKIDNDYNKLLDLSNMKLEHVKELEFIADKHYNELSTTVEKYKKDFLQVDSYNNFIDDSMIYSSNCNNNEYSIAENQAYIKKIKSNKNSSSINNNKSNYYSLNKNNKSNNIVNNTIGSRSNIKNNNIRFTNKKRNLSNLNKYSNNDNNSNNNSNLLNKTTNYSTDNNITTNSTSIIAANNSINNKNINKNPSYNTFNKNSFKNDNIDINLNGDNDSLLFNSNINKNSLDHQLDELDNRYNEGIDNQLYCFCQKESYGDMVGCDNDDCKYQWFHFGCVNITSQSAGEWFCSDACREMKHANSTKTKKKKKKY